MASFQLFKLMVRKTFQKIIPVFEGGDHTSLVQSSSVRLPSLVPLRRPPGARETCTFPEGVHTVCTLFLTDDTWRNFTFVHFILYDHHILCPANKGLPHCVITKEFSHFSPIEVFMCSVFILYSTGIHLEFILTDDRM